MDRRSFLVLVFSLGASTITLTVLGSGRGRVIRPPGVESEDEFLSLCIRCGKCVDVCPTHGLKLDYSSLIGLGTPVLEGFCAFYVELAQPSRSKNMEFKKKRLESELCFRCIDVCPTRALKRLPLSRIKMAEIDVVRERCRKGECYVCIDVCVFDAISISREGFPEVEPGKCVGCRQCEKLCPYNAMIAQASMR